MNIPTPVKIVNIGRQDTGEFVGHSGSSLRFGANIEGEIIYVKNVEFADKAD